MSEKTLSVTEQDTLRELETEIQKWVNRTFNFIQIEVVEKFCDNTMMEYIVHPDVEDAVSDWLQDRKDEELISEFFEATDKELDIQKYIDCEGTIESSFRKSYSDDTWDEYLGWLSENYQDDIQEYIYEQENYPMWNTLFEFRDSMYNNEIKNCMEVGLGVVEGLEPFNNMVFMTSCGHSFYSAYWIPLYFALNNNAKEKYKGIDYSSI